MHTFELENCTRSKSSYMGFQIIWNIGYSRDLNEKTHFMWDLLSQIIIRQGRQLLLEEWGILRRMPFYCSIGTKECKLRLRDYSRKLSLWETLKWFSKWDGSTALHSNCEPSHYKNKKSLYELFFQHFFQISRNYVEDGDSKPPTR